MGDIIELPGEENLRKEIKALKKRVSELVLERDDLKYTVCENIKTEYMLEIGKLEYKVYNLYIKYLRLKRKKDLIQIKINRNELVEVNAIERKLDSEFKDYQEKLNSKLDDINKAIERNDLEILSLEDSKKIKKLYLNLVKKVHPDLNPNQSEEKLNLFNIIVEAYRAGDLVKIESISFLLEDDENLDNIKSSLMDIDEEKARLNKIVVNLEKEIEEIKTTYPYIFKEFLENKDKKLARFEELNYQFASYKIAIETQKENIKILLRRLDE